MKALGLISTISRRCALTILSGISISAKPNPRLEPDYRALDAVITAELKDKHTPGAVVAVISDNKVVYAKAFGLANVETRAPMEKDMLFRIGSTTKMFTAAALVRLSEAGKIKLNEPIDNRVRSQSAPVASHAALLVEQLSR
jgi:CubicO group peptidase (beta-lactamase class C family)